MERFAKLAVDALNKVLEAPIGVQDLETPPDPAFGDFGYPCFRLAKAFKKSPNDTAKEIVNLLTSKGALPAGLEAAAVGPYVNFTAPKTDALRALLKDMLAGEGDGAYGKMPAKSRARWVVEYSSPNVAKPFMIYHFRPTGLGACFYKVGKYRGYDMIAINHLGDWGTQFGKLFVANEIYRAGKSGDPAFQELVEIYVRFHQDVEKDPALEDRARAAFRRLEQKDPEVTSFWKKCFEISWREFSRLYDQMGITFDHVWGESFYEDQLQPLLARLKQEGVLEQSEGAWVAKVSDEKGRELPPFILEKSDGGTIYGTRDVAAALYRYDKLRFDRMTYVVGGEQKLHFQQVFGVLRKLGCDWVDRCEHVPTGLYRFKDAKMSTRKGNFVTLEDVYALARERVRELVQSRESASSYTPAEVDEITEKVALGSIVFHDLHADPAREVEFDVNRVVDFEGETGAYLQYAHTRCKSILRKAEAEGFAGVAYDEALLPKLQAPEELALVKMLGQFPIYLERTLNLRKASQLAHFLIATTKAFGAFYRECQVLNAQDPELTRARLMLVEATRRILANGLSMLGIPLPERM